MQYTQATPARATALRVALAANITDPFGANGMGAMRVANIGAAQCVYYVAGAINADLAQWLGRRQPVMRTMLFASALLAYGGNFGIVPRKWPGSPLPRHLLRAAQQACGVFAMP